MVKIQKTISVDFEIWQELLLKTDNCSGTINELIKAYVNTTNTKNETDSLKVELVKLQAELGKRNEEIKKKETEAEKGIRKFKWGEPIY